MLTSSSLPNRGRISTASKCFYNEKSTVVKETKGEEEEEAEDCGREPPQPQRMTTTSHRISQLTTSDSLRGQPSKKRTTSTIKPTRSWDNHCSECEKIHELQQEQQTASLDRRTANARASQRLKRQNLDQHLRRGWSTRQQQSYALCEAESECSELRLDKHRSQLLQRLLLKGRSKGLKKPEVIRSTENMEKLAIHQPNIAELLSMASNRLMNAEASESGRKMAPSTEGGSTTKAPSNGRPPNEDFSVEAFDQTTEETPPTANASWLAVTETSALKKAEVEAEEASASAQSKTSSEAVHHHHHHHHYHHHHHHTLALSNQLINSKAALEVISGLEKANLLKTAEEQVNSVESSPKKIPGGNLAEKKRPLAATASRLVRSNTTIEVNQGRGAALNFSQPGSPAQLRAAKLKLASVGGAQHSSSLEEATSGGHHQLGSDPSSSASTPNNQPLLVASLSRVGSAKMSRSRMHASSGAAVMLSKQDQIEAIEQLAAASASPANGSSKKRVSKVDPNEVQVQTSDSQQQQSSKKEKYKSLWGKVGKHGLMQAAAASASVASNNDSSSGSSSVASGSAPASSSRRSKNNGWDQVLNPLLAKHRPQVNQREANYSYHVQKVAMGEAVAGSGWTGANMECDCGEDSCPRCNLMINMGMDEPQPQW